MLVAYKYELHLPQPSETTPDTTHSQPMDARTAAIAADAARIRAGRALKLRVVNHQFAAQIAVHARAIERHTCKLVRLHAKIKAGGIAIPGPDNDEHHAVGFEELPRQATA